MHKVQTLGLSLAMSAALSIGGVASDFSVTTGAKPQLQGSFIAVTAAATTKPAI